MHTAPTEKRFWYYVLPSMLTMVLSGFYVIVDGFFIGQATGDIGLGAINLAWPITAVMQATGIGVGIGGSVLFSMYQGAQDDEEARAARGNTIVLLFLFSVFMMVFFWFTSDAILVLFGARGALFSAARDYIRVIIFGTLFQTFGCGLTPLIKNSGRAISAMLIMVSGLVTNMILDALFIMVFPWGLAGAAAATVTAQGVVAALSMLLIVFDKKLPFSFSDLRLQASKMIRILKIGVSPFGVSLAPSIVIIFANWQCLAYGQETAVAAYSVLSYVSATFLALLQGIGDGVQPIISYLHGAGETKKVEHVRFRAVRLAVLLGTAFFLISIPTTSFFSGLFGVSDAAAVMAKSGLILTAVAYPFAGLVRCSISYFYATGDTKLSTCFTYLDPLVFTPVFLFLLPIFFDVEGIWSVLAAVQITMSLLILGVFFGRRKKSKKILKNA